MANRKLNGYILYVFILENVNIGTKYINLYLLEYIKRFSQKKMDNYNKKKTSTAITLFHIHKHSNLKK